MRKRKKKLMKLTLIKLSNSILVSSDYKNPTNFDLIAFM